MVLAAGVDLTRRRGCWIIVGWQCLGVGGRVRPKHGVLDGGHARCRSDRARRSAESQRLIIQVGYVLVELGAFDFFSFKILFEFLYKNGFRKRLVGLTDISSAYMFSRPQSVLPISVFLAVSIVDIF